MRSRHRPLRALPQGSVQLLEDDLGQHRQPDGEDGQAGVVCAADYTAGATQTNERRRAQRAVWLLLLLRSLESCAERLPSPLEASAASACVGRHGCRPCARSEPWSTARSHTAPRASCGSHLTRDRQVTRTAFLRPGPHAQMSSFKRNGRFVRTGNLVSSAPLWNACRGLANELQELAPVLAEGVALKGLSASPGARTHESCAPRKMPRRLLSDGSAVT